MMKLRQILCCAVLVLSASGMAQVSAGLHVLTRSEVGPQAMPKDIAPVKAPFQFQLAAIDHNKFNARQVTVKLKKGITAKYKHAAKNRQLRHAAHYLRQERQAHYPVARQVATGRF